jgi:hypothetical protein
MLNRRDDVDALSASSCVAYRDRMDNDSLVRAGVGATSPAKRMVSDEFENRNRFRCDDRISSDTCSCELTTRVHAPT